MAHQMELQLLWNHGLDALEQRVHRVAADLAGAILHRPIGRDVQKPKRARLDAAEEIAYASRGSGGPRMQSGITGQTTGAGGATSTGRRLLRNRKAERSQEARPAVVL